MNQLTQLLRGLIPLKALNYVVGSRFSLAYNEKLSFIATDENCPNYCQESYFCFFKGFYVYDMYVFEKDSEPPRMIPYPWIASW